MILVHPDIIDNKYYKLYLKIINSPDSNQYTETHHILPVSMGGTNDKNNLITFSARKHFLAHYLLTKFVKYKSKSWYSMVKAFNMMGCGGNTHQRYINSRLYESNRKHMPEVMRESTIGNKNSQYGTKWMYNIELDESRKVDPSDVDYMLSQGWLLGRKSKHFVTRMKRCRKPTQHLTGRKLKIYKNGYIAEVHELYFYRDYVIDGWKLLTCKKENKFQIVRIKHINGINNMMLPEHIAKEFVESKLWKYGYNYPK